MKPLLRESGFFYEVSKRLVYLFLNMNKELFFKTNFTEDKLPAWNCPSCFTGLFQLSNFKFAETSQSVQWRKRPEWEPEYIQYTFSGSLVCIKCGEFVAFSGNGFERFVNNYDNINDEYFEDNFSEFTPTNFFPPLQIFQINSNCPENIKQLLNDSFSLFWIDLNSCANKIRISLELLMDYLKVRKTVIDKNGKRKKITLHNRILLFGEKNKEVSKIFFAIKWIGNEGSHNGNLSKKDIIENYNMLQLALDKIFDNNEKKIMKIVTEINKRKGVRKR